MLRYIARRLIFLVPLWIGVSLIVFVVMRLMPGDVAAAMLGAEQGAASKADMEVIRHALGLDQPLHVQYITWVAKMATLDFGVSMYGKQPVLQLVGERLPATINLAVLASILSVAIGVPAGIISAVRRNTLTDYVTRVVSILGLALPSFWVAILISLGLVIFLKWSVPLEYELPWRNLGINVQKMIWPALVLGYGQAALVARMARSTMLDVLGEDYMRTAHAKGLHHRVIVTRHALRNALIPVVTVVGIYFALMLGGVVVLELVFTVPGVGSLLIESIRRRDYPVVEVLLLGSATVVMLVNLLIDATYAWLDPRIARG